MVCVKEMKMKRWSSGIILSHDLLKQNVHLTVGDQTLSYHLPMELSISSDAYNVNAMECVEQKRVTKAVWGEEKKDILIQVSRSDWFDNIRSRSSHEKIYKLFVPHCPVHEKKSICCKEWTLHQRSFLVWQKVSEQEKRNKESFK